MWIYSHDESSPCLIGLSSIFVSVGSAFGSIFAIVLFTDGEGHFSSHAGGEFGLLGDLFATYGVTDWDQGIQTVFIEYDDCPRAGYFYDCKLLGGQLV